jgi:hypothetical protein
VIESVLANLKGQMRLEQHLAETPAGLAVRIAQRILALTLGILLNKLSGRWHEPSPPTTTAESHQASTRGAALTPPSSRRKLAVVGARDPGTLGRVNRPAKRRRS